MNPTNGQTPLDYLNEISPQAQKKAPFSFNLRTVAFIGLVVVVLVIIASVVVGALANARVAPWERFSARLDTTSSTVDKASSEIKSSQLRSLNSDLKLYITNTKRDLAVPLEKVGVNPGKITPSIATEESGVGMTQRLEDGRLNAKFDSTYAREMSYQLATILALLQELHASSAQAETKDFLKTAYDNLQPTYEALSDFSASNE